VIYWNYFDRSILELMGLAFGRLGSVRRGLMGMVLGWAIMIGFLMPVMRRFLLSCCFVVLGCLCLFFSRERVGDLLRVLRWLILAFIGFVFKL
jgi:hypothetical protein